MSLGQWYIFFCYSLIDLVFFLFNKSHETFCLYVDNTNQESHITLSMRKCLGQEKNLPMLMPPKSLLYDKYAPEWPPHNDRIV